MYKDGKCTELKDVLYRVVRNGENQSLQVFQLIDDHLMMSKLQFIDMDIDILFQVQNSTTRSLHYFVSAIQLTIVFDISCQSTWHIHNAPIVQVHNICINNCNV